MGTMEATRPLVMTWWQWAEEQEVTMSAPDRMEKVEEEVAMGKANI